ncbi:MAG: glycosyl transferase family 1 [Planctomycetaceae bacterium]|nr:glycosyl transferase family 1 [Planctomycetaceae bacterium]
MAECEPVGTTFQRLKSARICIVQDQLRAASETFLRSCSDRLPAKVSLLHGDIPQFSDGTPLPCPLATRALHSRSLPARLLRKACSTAMHRPCSWGLSQLYQRAFQQCRADIVLAQYGTLGVRVMSACRRAAVPLVVVFRGHDASIQTVLRANAKTYPRLFREASAIVAVSRTIQHRLLKLGAPARKISCNPSGVDCQQFCGASPATSPPVFLAVGRFVDKKTPHLTIGAFKHVLNTVPQARLRMIGSGPLLKSCQELTRNLDIADAVAFLGTQTHQAVQQELRKARCFVQHSTIAPNGDAEGTPNSVMEASATGLPVVATRHGGIPDVVLHGATGLLVEEHDVAGMAASMIRLANDPRLARTLGQAGRHRVQQHYSVERSMGELCRILESCLPDGKLRRAA